MSIAVPLADLADALEGRPWGYLVTVGDDQRARFHAAPTRYEGGALTIDAGRSSRANAVARANVTLVFPPTDPHGMSLIVDGDATVDDDAVRVTPTWAVLHRAAIAAPHEDPTDEGGASGASGAAGHGTV